MKTIFWNTHLVDAQLIGLGYLVSARLISKNYII